MDTQHTIVFKTYSSIAEATMILDKLESNGIKAFLNDENVLGLGPVAGVELKIFENDLLAVENILSSTEA